MLLEMIKLRICGVTIPYCSRKKKQTLEKEKVIEEKINNLEKKLAGEVDKSQTLVNELVNSRNELQGIREYKIKGSMLRAKAEKYCNFEKPTKYFCNLEKQNYICKLISRLKHNDRIITKQDEILNLAKQFHSGLLESKRLENPITNLHFFINNKLKKLNENDKKICEGKKVLKQVKNGKSPGTDGYTAEFYKFFWRDLGDIVLNSLNDAFTIGHLLHTQKQGIITLIPKPNKAREDLKNWRPITLLNVEYKLLSGVLAHKIKQVLPNIIGNDQKGFLKNRYIG